MYTGRANCYHCPKNMVKQCELEFGTDGIPPCTKAVVENCHSLQQLKAEILSILIRALDMGTISIETNDTRDYIKEAVAKLSNYQPFSGR